MKPLDIAALRETFLVFLRLGCVSFGGPIAHLGYFRDEFVARRKWLAENEYADLLALCQFLPGPASSQVGFALGLRRAGVPGAFAAWLGFTLPSALLMIAFALGLGAMGNLSGAGWVAGLKLAAVAVVAHAVWQMAAKLTPDKIRATVALTAGVLVLLAGHPLAQVGVIALGAGFGYLAYRPDGFLPPLTQKIPGGAGQAASSRQSAGGLGMVQGRVLLLVFVGLLVALPLLAWPFGAGSWMGILAEFYRAGSLVFGGGHVVLPLLESSTVGNGLLSQDAFLAGYGAAQALPGPLFAFSSFLGTTAGSGGVFSGVWALLAIYLPSWLLILGAMPYWDHLRSNLDVRAALVGANAAVVGLLLAALYTPILTSAVISPTRAAVALAAFAVLHFWKAPAWAVAVGCALVGAILL